MIFLFCLGFIFYGILGVIFVWNNLFITKWRIKDKGEYFTIQPKCLGIYWHGLIYDLESFGSAEYAEEQLVMYLQKRAIKKSRRNKVVKVFEVRKSTQVVEQDLISAPDFDPLYILKNGENVQVEAVRKLIK